MNAYTKIFTMDQWFIFQMQAQVVEALDFELERNVDGYKVWRITFLWNDANA